MTTTIRPFLESDRPILREMTIAAFEGVSIDHNIDRVLGPIAAQDWRIRKGRHVDDDLDAPGGEIAVAVEEDGTVVGYVSMRCDREALVGQIPNLAVSADRRGQGIGRLLLEHAIARFTELGMAVARIETLEQNPVGRHLYPSVGFREVARQIHFAMSLSVEDGEQAPR
ncbi:GNAT family N-acetyltransferase [Tautonia plasticadhaerens]|uniref:Ribosomal-protein-alanine N-acetyltransferase n=1 Tax=Tautonia plasticadhaerens TaxID=2527974 RepID=A0A518GW67_9BACT|nr:GNAT family N-acetyltransferase [Tautonia plasticadhaerens]QDV32819.1 ribosomal-protein-alanine N-acetyltransferase [Tautonia plasticadhaerens]